MPVEVRFRGPMIVIAKKPHVRCILNSSQPQPSGQIPLFTLWKPTGGASTATIRIVDAANAANEMIVARGWAAGLLLQLRHSSANASRVSRTTPPAARTTPARRSQTSISNGSISSSTTMQALGNRSSRPITSPTPKPIAACPGSQSAKESAAKKRMAAASAAAEGPRPHPGTSSCFGGEWCELPPDHLTRTRVGRPMRCRPPTRCALVNMAPGGAGHRARRPARQAGSDLRAVRAGGPGKALAWASRSVEISRDGWAAT